MDHNVYINGRVCQLRDDHTVYLGMDAWFRVNGYKRWKQTDSCGRASLQPGQNYEMMISATGSSPNGDKFMDKLHAFMETLA